jgi:hypothetical protein
MVGLGDIKKKHLTIIVEEIITIFDNIVINAKKTMTIIFNLINIQA